MNLDNRMIQVKNKTVGGADSNPPESRYMDKLKEIRRARGMTQQQLADECGIERSRIANYEIDYREPSIDIIKKLCEALHCTPNDLLGVTVKEEA